MIVLYVLAALLLLTGGLIVSLQVLRKPSPFSFLTRRQIDPHLWGFHVMGAGFMLSLALMMLHQAHWNEAGVVRRVVVGAAILWTVAALGMSVAAVVTPSRDGAFASLFPPPNAKLASWPSSYRAFIALGFAAICVLGLMVF